ncbi:MAG: hypothetical protein KIS92_19400 [Planctomycetota bacterium]|nr:hypothetical protein [Planctomycetota bacterium]
MRNAVYALVLAVLAVLAAGLGAEEPVAPVAPVPAAEAARTFDSDLPLSVYDEDLRLLGRTPTWDWHGVEVPEGLWFVEHARALTAEGGAVLAREMQAREVPGLSVECDGRDPAWLAAFENLPVPRALSLRGAPPEALARAARLAQVTNLRIEGPLEDKDLAPLARMRQLRALRIEGGLTDAGLAALAALENLEELRVLGGRLTEAGLAKLAGLKKLRHLEATVSATEAGLAPLKDLDLRFVRLEAYTFDLCGRTTTLQSPVFTRHPARVGPRAEAAPEGEAARLKEALKDLGSDSFEKREAATEALRKGGRRALAFLTPKAKEEARGAAPDPERQKRLRGLLEDLTRACADAWEAEAAAGLPPEVRVREKLRRRIGFELAEQPPAQAFERIGRHCGVRVTQPEAGAFPPISLRVTDMPADLALDWICKLAEARYEVHGGEARVLKGGADRGPSVAFPAPAGEVAWTDAEKRRVGRLLDRLPGASLEPLCIGEALADGGLPANSPGEVRRLLRRLALPRGQIVPGEPTPALDALDAQLATKIDPTDMEKVRLDVLVSNLHFKTQARLGLDPNLAAQGMPLVSGSFPGGTAREALAWICRVQGYACVERVSEDGGHVYVLCTPDRAATVSSACVVDLRPALDAGVPQQDLEDGLERLLTEGRLPAPLHSVVRGRWVGRMDPWTERRAFAWVAACADAKKIAALPPAPWFFPTFNGNK